LASACLPEGCLRPAGGTNPLRAEPARPGVISLRSEQAAVVQRIREEVSLLAGDTPPEIALLLTSAESTQPARRAAVGAPL